MNKFIYSFIFLFIMANQVVAQAQTGSNYTISQAKEMLKRHNHHREEVKVDKLKWSKEIASYAQDWADELAQSGCEIYHSDDNKYGENIFWGFGGNYTPTYVTDSWADEKKGWNGEAISMENYGKIGHYTQMIWYNTTHVGCGIATCSDGAIIVVCNYNPAGNFIGESPIGYKLEKDTYRNSVCYKNHDFALINLIN